MSKSNNGGRIFHNFQKSIERLHSTLDCHMAKFKPAESDEEPILELEPIKVSVNEEGMCWSF